ncbi:MAG: hypothetical protein HQL29_01530 [Candidatus Omnitrophica bacterium]|nr:hypothetical protein [Candidatus Omnitrophota bacterium]
MMKKNNGTAGRMYGLFVLLFVLIVFLGVLSLFSMRTLSAVRAYVSGCGTYESLQKKASYELYKYIQEQKPEEYQEFQKYIGMNSEYRIARVELEKKKTDIVAVRTAMIAAGVHEKDISEMIKLFKRFRSFKQIDKAIVIWEEADNVIEELSALGEEIHQKINDNKQGVGLGDEKEMYIVKADLIQDRISELCTEFSMVLGVASRWAAGLLAKAMFAGFSIIALLGVGIAVFTIKRILIIIKRVKISTTELLSASTEIFRQSQQQELNARDQASLIKETSTAANELSATASFGGENIKKIALSIEHLTNGIEKIKETLSKTSKMITYLNSESQKIGKLTEVIDDVADRTNLLALNASIEAAHAGEGGRGFSVVAGEIRKLADSTAKSTKEITDIIKITEKEIANVAASMKNNVDNVDEETKRAKVSFEMSNQLISGAAEQISGSQQIALAMKGVDEAMKQILEGSQETKKISQQLKDLSTSMEQLLVDIE